MEENNNPLFIVEQFKTYIKPLFSEKVRSILGYTIDINEDLFNIVYENDLSRKKILYKERMKDLGVKTDGFPPNHIEDTYNKLKHIQISYKKHSETGDIEETSSIDDFVKLNTNKKFNYTNMLYKFMYDLTKDLSYK